jgi:hypothetical protein
MKDGRSSRIFDVRYFCPDRNSYLEGRKDVTAYGRRMAWFLNGEELSLGAYHSLYLCFTSSLEPGAVRVTDEGREWWHRYTYVGVSDEFPNNSGAVEVALRGTAAALKSIRPDACELIDRADKAVRQHGADLRFLIRSKPYKQYILKVASTIAAHPNPSLLYVSVTDRESGVFVEVAPVPVSFCGNAFSDAASIGIRDIEVGVSSNGELSAQWSEKLRHGWPSVVKDAHQVVEPFYSKLVKRQ